MSAPLPVAERMARIDPIGRIADYLAAETDALRRFAPCDLLRGNHVKSQALLELTRHARTLAGRGDDPDLRGALETLRTRLVENGAALALNLDAARTLNAIIVEAVERDVSDRTYGRAKKRPGR